MKKLAKFIISEVAKPCLAAVGQQIGEAIGRMVAAKIQPPPPPTKPEEKP